MLTMKHIASSFSFAAAFALVPQPAAAQHTVTYTFQFPEFSSKDNFIFQARQDVAVPYFNAVGGDLYLTRARFTLDCTADATYTMTNIGTRPGIAWLKSEPTIIATGPGPLWGSPFGTHTSGIFLNPGESGPTFADGINRTSNSTLGNAQVYVGQGDYIISTSITQTISVVDPQNFTAAYSKGWIDPVTLTVTYTYRCLGDTDADSAVGINDLLSIIENWGQIGFCGIGQPCPPDMSPPWGDNLVNVNDLLVVISNWGPCPSPT